MNFAYLKSLASKFGFKDKICLKSVSSQKQKRWTAPLNSAYSNSSWYQISVSTNNFDFFDQICQTKYFQSKTEKVNITNEFCISELVLVPNFSLNWQFGLSGPNLPKKSVSSLNQKKWTQPLNSAHSNSLHTKFQFKLTIFFFFWAYLSNKVFPVENWKC